VFSVGHFLLVHTLRRSCCLKFNCLICCTTASFSSTGFSQAFLSPSQQCYRWFVWSPEPLLPQSATASQHYNLRHRAHSLQLPEHLTQLSDSKFLTRMLCKNTLLGLVLPNPFFTLLCCWPAFCHAYNKQLLIDWLRYWRDVLLLVRDFLLLATCCCWTFNGL